MWRSEFRIQVVGYLNPCWLATCGEGRLDTLGERSLVGLEDVGSVLVDARCKVYTELRMM
jgi:hypothetical protein